MSAGDRTPKGTIPGVGGLAGSADKVSGWRPSLTEFHRADLRASGVTDAVMQTVGVWSGSKGWVLPWSDSTDRIELAIPDRDKRDEFGGRKTLWPKDQTSIVNHVREVPGTRKLVAEGPRQQLAAASHAPADVSVYGTNGCDGIHRKIGDRLAWAKDAEVWLAFDADHRSNERVRGAVSRVARLLRKAGAREVYVIDLSPHAAEPSDGLDDVLPRAEDPAGLLSELMDKAERADEVTGTPAGGLDVSNVKLAADYLRDELGTGKLAGVFLRGAELVRTPRIGEEGYLPPAEGSDDGPAQVRPMTPAQLAAHVSYVHECFVVRKRGEEHVAEPALFPEAAARTAVLAADHLRSVRPLKGVTHTPLVRADGSILTAPGYDAATGLLHLPEPGLTVPEVAENPSAEEVAKARELLTGLVADFPFITEHDRTNYLGLLITPLLRSLCPPPYKMGAITAPSPGAGKTLLADIVRELHGGVFRSELPRDDEEVRKQVSAILDVTTGPVVHFDNLSGVLRSSVLAGLLTSAQWDDRRLGATQMLSVPNDRLWLITGNNLAIGGDLPRRTVTVTIDPRMPNPHLRTGYGIDPLLPWVRENRGELLWAILTLVRAWHAAGRPTRGKRSSDSFGVWIETVDGILSHAEIAGRFDDPDSQPEPVGADDSEWADLLHAMHQVFGTTTFTVREVLDRMTAASGAKAGTVRPLTVDALPAELSEKVHRSSGGPAVVAKSLGMWLRNRAGRYAGSYTVRNAGKDRNGVALWRLETAGRPDDLAGSEGSAGSSSGPLSVSGSVPGQVITSESRRPDKSPQTTQTPQRPRKCKSCGSRSIRRVTSPDGSPSWGCACGWRVPVGGAA